MISRSPKRCRHGLVRTEGPIVRVSNSTSLRVMFMAAPHRADWCQNSLTRHPCGKVRNTSLIVTLTPTGCMIPWSMDGGIFQVYMKFLHERFSALLLALTLYNIYIYQHKTCSVSPLTHCEVRLLILCTNFVYILAALWRIDTTT